MTPIASEPNNLKIYAPFVLPFVVLIGGIATAMIVDYLDPHIYTGEDMESVLGFSPIGSLFADKEVTQLVFDEGVLRLAAAVDHATRVSGTRTFLLSAVDKNGQTASTLDNLAHALAGLGRKVITIDASGKAKPVAYVNVETNDSNYALRNLAVSPLPSRIAPLPSFVSEAFQKLTTDYEIVLIDTAPLLSSAETEYLARCADVTMLVATAGKTTKGRLARAARLLEGINVPGVAAIISEVSLLRVGRAAVSDVRESEERMSASNLHWKPKFTPFVVNGAYRNEDAEEAANSAEQPVADLG